MKFVFIDLQDEQVDIAEDVLKSYGVVYSKQMQKVIKGFSKNYYYDISVDVEPEFYEFLKTEINDKIKQFNILENSWDLLAVENEKDTLKDKVDHEIKKQNTFIDKAFKEAFPLSSLFPLFEAPIGNLEDSTIVKFEDLEDNEKELLLRTVPKDVLQSPKCIIRKTKDGLSIQY